MIAWWTLWPAGLFLLVLMTLIWSLSIWLRNAGIVDVAWAFGFAPLCWLYAALAPASGPRATVFIGMVSMWAIRLGWHLGHRVLSHHPAEDARYAALRVRWGKNANWNMLTFFYLQGALMLLLSILFLVIFSWPAKQISMFEAFGISLWLFAFAGESLSDAQLAHFKANPRNKGTVCDRGLWRYSRHPNYFFEWLVWVSFFVYALPCPWGWTTIVAPALMLYFLLFVTGVKATEEQSIKTKGDTYRRYQKSTSVFVPWRPREI
jgi:steroid 5-alpha reductase family enzyme